jgi:prolyl oligopeptidase
MTTIDRRTLMLSAGSAALMLRFRLASAARAAAPPVARVEPVTETFFGTRITDPYRWMENPKDKDWQPFMKEQAAYARATLDGIPGRAALAKRISELSGDLEVLNSIQLSGPYVFIEKRRAGANNFQLFVREGADGPERLLIDPETRTQGDTHYALNYWVASPDGRYVAYGISPAGSENAVIEIMEVATGKILPDRIDRAQYAFPSWLPDSSGFFFNRLAEGAQLGSTDYYKNSVNWLHKVGTDSAKDIRVLSRGQFADVTIEEIEFPSLFVQPDSRFVVAVLYAGVQNELTIWVNTIDAASKGAAGWKRVCAPEDKVTNVTYRGEDIFLLTYKNAPRYRLLSLKASDPDIARAREVVPQSASVIQSMFAARDGIYLQDLDGGVGRLRKLTADEVVPVKLPFDGVINSAFADPTREGIWFGLESWVKPSTVFHADAGGVHATNFVAQPRIDVSAYESTRIFATAKDGTQIPVSVVYKKGIKRDGSAPTLIDAYGAYGINSDPYFAPRYIAWLDQGGVWATAHVRGGGEFGREWHEAGRLLTKDNTWLDMIAAAEKLIADRWSSASKLAIRGGSAGGIMAGRSLTERPDLFAAVISQVGVSNSLRAEFSQNGPPNVPEFGSVSTQEGFKGLYEMDSYQHVKDGVRYPAVLLTTGMTDPRVDPWQAAKMAARLQKASTSGKPVLLRVEFQAGHGIGSTRSQRDDEYADIFAFVLWQAGAPGFQPS